MDLEQYDTAMWTRCIWLMITQSMRFLIRFEEYKALNSFIYFIPEKILKILTCCYFSLSSELQLLSVAEST
jgi:hypothetical protein